ncbi:ABC transporter permease [Arthrobacter sp. StoSoilB20]|uniref:ABC transporter permease n=1 Tax=Arthrobacter sp. StoSoilB20 TaxID=2830995 RepID=UPI001CC513B8|nr:ABC transporter permease [Arthrobacter sp. StoSoilB20]BCW58645.1 ABC transporter permease [Arthrobacter sp. StoSoilB20]
MTKFILQRLLAGILTIGSLCVLTFFLLNLRASDAARNILGQNASQELVDRKTQQLGLDRPLTTQFLEWASGAVQGNLGRSWFTGQSVTEALLTRLPVTLTLTIGAVLLSAVVAVCLGAASARQRGPLDRFIQIASVTVAAVPGFLMALALVLMFALSLRWFPATGYTRPDVSFPGWLSTITLPVLALSIAATASVAQQIRGSMIDAMRLDYVRTLRARGLPEGRVMFGHVLRNAAAPALSVLGLQFIVLFGGAVVVEQVFSLPGLGQSAIAATAQGDIPIVMGLVILTAIVVFLVNLAIDLLQGWLNPKMRQS